MIGKIIQIWSAGGWVMWPLLALAILMFFTAARLWLDLGSRQYRRLTDEQWKLWVRKPETGEGEVGEMIRYVQDEVTSASEISTRFAEVSAGTLPPMAASAPVTVVPMAAPMTSEAACSKFTAPACRAVSVAATAALEDCMTMVSSAPSSMASK